MRMESTAIRRFAYDHRHRELEVIFTTGRRYVYFDVPTGIHQAFIDSESKGIFFNTRIRPHFRYRELASTVS
jgi:hypothetical protein